MLDFSERIFWDIDYQELDYQKHKTFIVSRILDYGNWEDWLTLKKIYSFEEIKKTALQIRSLFPESLAFISLITEMPIEEFRCYKLSQSNPKHWL